MLEAVAYLSSISLGLYAGALLTEGVILVPYWRRMIPADFFRLHHEVGPSLFRYFAPLTILPVALSIMTVGLEIYHGLLSIPRLVAAFGACLAVLTFFFYFRKANLSFAAHSLTDADLAPELRRWAFWHWIRTLVIVASFMASASVTS